MCRITDDPDDLCHDCWHGGWCWSSLGPSISTGTNPSSLYVRTDELTGWDWVWMSPESILYWTVSGAWPRARAYA